MKRAEVDAAAATARPLPRPFCRRLMPAFVAVILLATAVRLVNIQSPFVGWPAFRETQTAITVFWFLHDGLDPLGYQTPVFGPPWRVPFEFPIFQMTAFLVAKTGLFSLDVACRLTALLYFAVSALFLFVLCRRIFNGSMVAWCTLLMYVCSPFVIYWSVQCLIDYAGVAFALGYLYFFYVWLRDAANWWLLVGAVVLGCLAYLTKVTTMAAFVIPIGALILSRFWEQYKSSEAELRFVRRSWRLLLGAGIGVVVPVVVGAAWMHYRDQVVAASPYTAWLTSAALKQWNYGTWAQRQDLKNWAMIGKRIAGSMAPYALVLLPLAGAVAWRRLWLEGKVLFLTALAGCLAPIVIFFNLYVVHEYYLIAITPLVALVVGLGAECLLFGIHYPRRWMPAVLLAGLVFSLWGGWTYMKPMFQENDRNDLYRVGQALRELTQPQERIVITDHDWSPDILYYAQRKGFMVRGSLAYAGVSPSFLKENHFSVAVGRKELPPVLGLWKNSRFIKEVGGYRIYRVSDEPEPREDAGHALVPNRASPSSR